MTSLSLSRDSLEACEQNCSGVLWDYTGFCLKIDCRRSGGSSDKAIVVTLVRDKDDLLSGYSGRGGENW